MKKLCVFVLLILAFCFTTACASTGTPGDGLSPVSQISPVVIEIGRAAARIGLNAALQSAGVPDTERQIILAQLRTVADGVLAGKDVRAVLADVNVWQPLRADLVTRLGAIIAQAQVSGIPLYDKVSSESMAGALIDSFAAAVRSRG